MTNRAEPTSAYGHEPHQSVKTAYRTLRAAQKPMSGVPGYTRWVNRPLGRGVAACAAVVGLSPNAVTAISAVFSLGALSLIVLLEPSAAVALCSAALLVAGYVFDSADGQTARLSGRQSPSGEWLDHVVDSIRMPAIHLSVMVSAWLHTGYPQWLPLVAAAFVLLSAGQFMSQILAEQILARHLVKRPDTGTALRQSVVLIPTDTGVLCLLFLVWSLPWVFAWSYATIFMISSLHATVSMRRRFRELANIRVLPADSTKIDGQAIV